MSGEPKLEKHWSLDRRVPIAMIWTIIAQTAMAVWWVRGLQEATTTRFNFFS